jgi:putative transposase
MEYKTNNNIVYSCKYHVVWCPKYRRKVLVDKIAERLEELIKQKSSDMRVDIIEMEIQPDHVHLLVEVDPQFGVNKYIKQVKGYTSYVMRKEFVELTTKLPTLWSNSYFIATVGGSPLSVIKQYIESQKRSQREK